MAEVGGRSRVLAVAGTLGAGKTTLVNGLWQQLGWERCPSRSPDPRYVERIHTDPARWSFEAQLNFVVLKASALRDALVSGRDVIVDRTYYEDRDVMARSWSEKYWDEHAKQTYVDCAGLLLDGLPAPDAIVFCRCAPEVCEQRRLARPRRYESHYDPEWVTRLNELYEQWVAGFKSCPLLEVDTERHDVRRPVVVASIIEDLATYFAPPDDEQGILFNPDGIPLTAPYFDAPAEPAKLHVLRELNRVPPRSPVAFRSEKVPLLAPTIRHPSVYLAAPFTTRTVAPDQLADELRLATGDQLHGVIPQDYRNLLERVARVFEQDGIQVILPHRDLNAWGETSLTPREVAQACLDCIRVCDGFVGLLGQSFGAHVEAGMAIALGKTSILVEVAELGETFMGRGLMQRDGAVELRVEKLADVPGALISTNAIDSVR